MGMIPIGLAAAVFVLLLTLLSYNTLRTHLAQLQALATQATELLRTWNQQLELVESGTSTAEAAPLRVPVETWANQPEMFLHKVPDLFSATPAELSGLAQDLRTLWQQGRSALLHYNGLVSKGPTRVVARWFGFRPISG
ncbi:hypothetical protein SAMN05421823_104207 [Catalinimonas alkaloidigena]|uniref:Uncharacterized protein n=1 Tax=Catalinimonas alkaloidigena TaxID=1075417 RepID=A0A1G9GSS0_9BACT|nr:hypothetical protein [Catalinimonas alkaloidigena]SDL03739.1 hypothetical protein SAMN05421823_104207 [Catalinimonas alkaloidigena]